MMIKITPLDTLFFRDGKPFRMGEDTWAEGIFPPLPSTIYGAMRTAYISHNGSLQEFHNGKMKEKIGTHKENEKGSFKIKGVYLQRRDDILLPLPLDLVKDKHSDNEDKNKAFRMKLYKHKNLFITNSILPEFLFPDNIENVETVEKAFINDLSLKEFLNGSKNNFQTISQNEIISIEPKVGIKRTFSTHTSEEGHLYRVGMNRLAQINYDKTINEVSLLVDYDGLPDFPDSCLLKIGGEGKSAVVKKIDDFKIPELSLESKNKINNDKRFKVYFATPAIFKNGWLPDDMDKISLEWKKDGLKLKLLSAVIGKPISAGGWDIANNKPKIMQKAVPSGSIYFFEILEGDANGILDKVHYKNISSDEGFGLGFVGVI